jgi:hypothetical protein
MLGLEIDTAAAVAATAVALGTEKGRGRGRSEILSRLDEQMLILVVGCVVRKRAARLVKMTRASRLGAVVGAAAKAHRARIARAACAWWGSASSSLNVSRCCR